MDDGAKVGTVNDLIFRGVEMVSLVVKGERGEGLLPYERVNENGPDALMIDSYTAIDWSSGLTLEPGTRSVHELRKLSVVDAEGNLLGRLHEFTITPKGRMEDLYIKTEGVFGIGSHESVVSQSRIRAFGPDAITVEMGKK